MFSNLNIETVREDLSSPDSISRFFYRRNNTVDTSIFNSELPVWFRKTKADTQCIVFNQLLENKYLKYYNIFLKKYNSLKEEFKNVPFNQVFLVLKQALETLILINPDNLFIGATSDVSIYFRFSLNNKNFYLEIFFETEDKLETHSVLNVFEDRKLIYSFGGTLKETLAKVDDNVDKEEYQEVYYPNHELSGSFIAETELQNY